VHPQVHPVFSVRLLRAIGTINHFTLLHAVLFTHRNTSSGQIVNEIISRAEAKARGLTHYFTGEPCGNGHVAVRYTSKGKCVECIRDKGLRYNEKYPGKNRERKAIYNTKNADLVREGNLRWRVENKEHDLERKARWRMENPDKVRGQRDRDRDKHNERSRLYYISNADKMRDYMKRYRAGRIDKLREHGRISTRELARYYIAGVLGISVKQLTPELLTLKRQQIEFHRLEAELNVALKEISK
jgi:hypothetical protein